ncbi:26042_t:CDS:2, partial [Racocetra persica]
LYTGEGLYTSKRLYTNEEVGNYDDIGDYKEVGNNISELSSEKEMVSTSSNYSELSINRYRRYSNKTKKEKGKATLKAAPVTKNIFDLIYHWKQKKTRISKHHNKTNLSHSVGSNNEQILPEHQKADIPD